MRKIVLIGVLFLVPAYVYAAIFVHPEDEHVVMTLDVTDQPQELFGKLEGFPHTYQFEVSEPIPFVATFTVPDSSSQKNDVSVIIVRAEERGVSEVGRTFAKDSSWEGQRDTLFAETFRMGGRLESILTPGSYILEVSSPSNDGRYKLVLGTEKIKRSYFENVQMLFKVKHFTGSFIGTILLSPLIYWPLLLCVCVLGLMFFSKRKKRAF